MREFSSKDGNENNIVHSENQFKYHQSDKGYPRLGGRYPAKIHVVAPEKRLVEFYQKLGGF
jgi:hypothetical protein